MPIYLAKLHNTLNYFAFDVILNRNPFSEKSIMQEPVQQQDGAAAVILSRLASLDYVGLRAAHPKRWTNDDKIIRRDDGLTWARADG